MSEVLKKIDDYIKECAMVLDVKNDLKAKDLTDKIISTFKNDIQDIEDGQTHDILDIYLEADEYGSEYGDEYIIRADNLKNLRLVKDKLELYSAKLKDENTRNRTMKNQEGMKFVLNNTNNNTNNNNLKLLFKDTKKEIENNESLSEEEIREVLEKIKEIEEISESDEPRNKKWFKLRPMMKWIGTKGVSVATSVLGLITAVLEMQ